jgi:uncharacterized protein (DUF488 family)
MAPMTADVLTIGHSNMAADRFLGLLKSAAVTTIADVRSVPFSRRFPWFSSRTLADRLHSHGIGYIAMGDTLGGRPADPALYRDGIADYEAMAATPEFRDGLDRVAAETRHHRLCLMCSEREPLECHRCLLVGRALAERGVTIGHILADGSVEPHAATIQRMLSLTKGKADLFGGTDMADAYRRRSRKIAARLADRVRPGRTPRAVSR